MQNSQTDLLEIILRECANSRTSPWYPAEYAKATGLPRAGLDDCLDHLRLAGLIRLTPWVQNHGQGYQLTPHGEEVLQSPRLMSRLRSGEIPQPRPEPEPATAAEPGLAVLRGEKVRSALLDDSPPLITRTLLAMNVVWFLVGAWVYSRHGGTVGDFFMPINDPAFGQTLRETGALNIVDVARNGQWWRLLSYGFVHPGGLLHIGMNMMALMSLGPLLERMWGRACYLAVYLTSCAAGGAAALLIQPEVPVGGASGAICGLLGSMGAWVFLNRRYMPPQLVANWQRNILMNVVLLAIISSLPGISWQGHLGGFLGGAAASLPLSMARFGKGPQRWLGWVGLATSILVCALIVVPQIMAKAAHRGIVVERNREDPVTREEVVDLLKADEIAREAMTVVKEMLRRNAKKPDPAFAAKVREKLQSSQDRLEQCRDSVQKKLQQRRSAAPFVTSGLEYVAKSAALCGQMAQSLAPDSPWPLPNVDELRAQLGRVETANSEFKKEWKMVAGGE